MKRTAGIHGTHRGMQILTVFLLFALLFGLFYSQVYRSARAMGRETVLAETLVRTERHEGYLFRDERAVLDGGNNGPVEYLVADGDTVVTGQAIANAFTDSSGTDKRAVASALYAEIEQLELAKSEAKPWQSKYIPAYADMMRAVGAGDWGNGLAAAGTLEESLSQRSAEQGTDAVDARIAALREELAALLQHEYADGVTAAADGYFCREADGYEASFGTAAAEGLTPDGLQKLINGRNLPDSGTIGKLVGADLFCLAVPMGAEQADAYAVGFTYPVTFAKGAPVSMILREINPSANGEEALLVFVAERLPFDIGFDRRCAVEIECARVRGLSVPYSALEKKDGECSVYILLDGVVRKRHVELLATEGGGCIVTPSIDEAYLREGDQVLITLRNVYDGKVLYR